MARALAQPASRPAERTASADRRLIVAVLALATVIAALLRLPFLATQSLWFDETYTVHVVQAGSLGELWHRIGASESTPPLFYLLAWGWTHAVGSTGAAAVRAVSALALVAAVPVAFWALRRLAGPRAALAVAGLLAVSPLLSWYALDARAYGLLVLTALLSVWAFGAVLEENPRGPASAGYGAGSDTPSPRRLVLWALAAAAAVWTHWFAGFLVLAEVVALLWLCRDAWRGTLLASCAVVLALLPLAGLLREQTDDDRAAFIAGSGLAGRLEQTARQFAAGPNVPHAWLEVGALALALAALAGGAWLTARRARRGDDGARALLALAAVALLVPLALAALGVYDRFNVRNVLFLWPLAAALAAPALLRLRGAPLAALLALGIATTLWTQTSWPYENADWHGAIARVEARAPDQAVIALTPLGEPVAALYLHRAPAAMPLATRRAWLVVEPARSAGRRDLHAADAPLVTALLAAFPQHRETRLHGFRLIALSAPAPVTLDPARLPGASLFAAVRSGSG